MAKRVRGCQFCEGYESYRQKASKDRTVKFKFRCALRVKAYRWKESTFGEPLYTITIREDTVQYCPRCGKTLTKCRQDERKMAQQRKGRMLSMTFLSFSKPPYEPSSFVRHRRVATHGNVVHVRLESPILEGRGRSGFKSRRSHSATRGQNIPKTPKYTFFHALNGLCAQYNPTPIGKSHSGNCGGL